MTQLILEERFQSEFDAFSANQSPQVLSEKLCSPSDAQHGIQRSFTSFLGSNIVNKDVDVTLETIEYSGVEGSSKRKKGVSGKKPRKNDRANTSKPKVNTLIRQKCLETLLKWKGVVDNVNTRCRVIDVIVTPDYAKYFSGSIDKNFGRYAKEENTKHA